MHSSVPRPSMPLGKIVAIDGTADIRSHFRFEFYFRSHTVLRLGGITDEVEPQPFSPRKYCFDKYEQALLNKSHALSPPWQSIECSLSCCASLFWAAGELKDQGNTAFKAGRLKPARSKYTKALRLADRIFDIETEEQVPVHAHLPTALSGSDKIVLAKICWDRVHALICP